MTILIIDDQISVIKGLESGIHFQELGIDKVLTANNAEDAKKILSGNTVHIMLCDIEMPGENGLDLNKWTAERYPEIIRILLSSHADFSFAQRSLKLGCFDYIVQPAPFDEIEDCLKRAIKQLSINSENRQLYNYGNLYSANEYEISGRFVLNLYSTNKDNVEHAIKLLNQIGYPLAKESSTQLILFDILNNNKYSSFSILDILNAIYSNLKKAEFVKPIYYLLTQNPVHQFVLLLFSNEADTLPCQQVKYESFYKELTSALTDEIACYIGNCSPLSDFCSNVQNLHAYIDNNVSKKKGLYFIDKMPISKEQLDLAENLKRWKLLLDNGQFSKLRSSILSYIDLIVSVNKINFNNLCDLHQQLTYIFFNYAFVSEIDITDLFTTNYQYSDYMDSFKSIDDLRNSINFITNAIEKARQNEDSKNDVQKAKNYIINNIAQNITVADVAEYVHLSPEYFTKLFKQETGHNIKNYILQLKINVAKDLLNNPNIPVSLVALELGYSNFSHFTQLFKKFENTTPSEYRKKIFPNSQLSDNG